MLVSRRTGFISPTMTARMIATTNNFCGGRLKIHVVPRKGSNSPAGGLVIRTPSVGGMGNGSYSSYSPPVSSTRDRLESVGKEDVGVEPGVSIPPRCVRHGGMSESARRRCRPDRISEATYKKTPLAVVLKTSLILSTQPQTLCHCNS